MALTISPVTVADIPILARISHRAFLTDTHTQMKAHYVGFTQFEDGSRQHLESLLAHPRCLTVLAKDGDVNVGWLSFARRGYPQDEQKEQPKVEDDHHDDGTSEDVEEEEGAKIAPPAVNNASAQASKTIADLESLTNASMDEWMEKLMPPGIRCRYIMGISVDPSAQSRGVGTKLLQYMTSLADNDGVFCWVHASMGGWPAFSKSGFVEVGRLEAGLDEYAGEAIRPETAPEGLAWVEPEGGFPGPGKWGKYVWRYMRREARLVKE